MDKVERLFNLVALLLDTRRALSAAEIRSTMLGYRDQGDEAFHRMFERDKAELRDIGFVLEQEQGLDGEIRYRIAKDETLLADPGLVPDEIAALSIAAQAWGRQEGTLGFLKLSAAAGVSDLGATSWLVPRVALDRAVETMIDAIERRKLVRFPYRGVGAVEVEERAVEPHALVHRGDWYLVGHDRARADVRRFKLSRIVGDVRVETGAAPDFERPAAPSTVIPRGPWEGEEIAAVVRVRFGPNAAWWVERRTGARRLAEDDDGWVELEMPCADVHTFAAWIAGFAADACVVEPPSVRDAVQAHLRAVMEA